MSQPIAQAVSLLRLHFQLTENELELTEWSSDQLEQQLERLIRQLIKHDLNGLLNALYKIDISESRFKEILALAPPTEISIVLTREIIARELKKVETREKYKNF